MFDLPLSWQQTPASQQTTQQQIMGGANAAMSAANIYLSGRTGINEAKRINTNVSGQQFDVYGRPVFNLGADINRVAGMNPTGLGAGHIANSIGQGAMAGSAFGPYGIAAGALIGGFISGAQSLRKRALETKQRAIARKNLLAAQNQFNSALSSFNQQQAARGVYDNLMNDSERFQNFYRF